MKKYISVLLLSQLGSMLHLEAMSVAFSRALARNGRRFFAPSAVQDQPSYNISSSSLPRIGKIRYYSSNYAEGPTTVGTNEGFVADEHWEEVPAQVRRELGTHAYRNPFVGEAPASASSDRQPLYSINPSAFLSESDQPVASRVDEAEPFVQVKSWRKYEPEAYENLNPLQKKLISEADYQKFVHEYQNLKDVEIYTYSYDVDGQPVVGWALLPKHVPASGKFPLVIALRGGFNGDGVFHEWAKTDLPYIMRHFLFYAQNGYAVLTSQYRGADGNTNKDQFGGGDVRDVLALFEIARAMGNIDMNDISLSVFSRGTVMGYKTVKALEDRTPIKAMIIKGGISDLETFVKEDPKYIVPILEQARPDFKERQEEITRDISLVRDAGVLKGIPTLVMHNKNDNVVPSKLSENLTQALHENGVEHETHYFSGKHHQILEHNDAVQDLTLKWLNKHRNPKVKASL